MVFSFWINTGGEKFPTWIFNWSEVSLKRRLHRTGKTTAPLLLHMLELHRMGENFFPSWNHNPIRAPNTFSPQVLASSRQHRRSRRREGCSFLKTTSWRCFHRHHQQSKKKVMWWAIRTPSSCLFQMKVAGAHKLAWGRALVNLLGTAILRSYWSVGVWVARRVSNCTNCWSAAEERHAPRILLAPFELSVQQRLVCATEASLCREWKCRAWNCWQRGLFSSQQSFQKLILESSPTLTFFILCRLGKSFWRDEQCCPRNLLIQWIHVKLHAKARMPRRTLDYGG